MPSLVYLCFLHHAVERSVTHVFDSCVHMILPGSIDNLEKNSRSLPMHVMFVQGILINGCIRDSEDIGKMPLGVKALNTYPLKSSKRDNGLPDVPLTFAGVNIRPGDFLYADKDGVLVSPTELK